MRDPDYLIRVHLWGDVPSHFASIIDDFPDRVLSGEFYETIGFHTPGKEFKIEGKDVQAQFLECNEDQRARFSHVGIYFFDLSNRSSYTQIGNVFHLSHKRSRKFTQTVIGFIGNSIQITPNERIELTNHKSIEYHEFPAGDRLGLKKLLLRILERSLSLILFYFRFTCIGSKRKTQFIHHYAEGKFSKDYLPTIGVDITTKRVNLRGLQLKLIIVDTAGQEFFSHLRPSYYRGSSACIIFIDDAKTSPFSSVKEWFQEFRVHIPDPSLPVALIRIMNNNETLKDKELELFIEKQELNYYEIREGDTKTLSQVFDTLLTQIFKLMS